jgi:long-chain acyl-CoA synthetase
MNYQPRYPNIVELLTRSVERFPQRPLFGTRKPHGWHFTTYAEFGALVAAARSGLASLGIRPGDKVAVISDNRVEWAVGSFATLSRGAVYVPMYQAQLDKDYRHILRDSESKLCFCANAKIAERVRALLPELPALQHIVDFEGPDYAQLLAKGRETTVPIAVPNDNELAYLIYTSGTTGEPKGVELSHLNLGAAASAVLSVAPLTENFESTLSFLPWAHVFGSCVELTVIIGCGGSLAICDNTERLIDYLAETKPSALFAVPRIWNRIYDVVNKQISARPKPVQLVLRAGLSARARKAKGATLSLPERVAALLTEKLLVTKIKQRLGGRVRFAVSGAAALAPEVAEFIDNLGIVVLEGYGLTETSAAATGSKPHERRTGSVGKALPGMRIVLDKQVATAGPDEGEIIVYGASVMLGYHNLQDDTRATMTEDGGLRTGDLGRLDADGFLFITGRVKELYKLSNGKYIAPAALEEALQLSPYIAQAFVYGSDQPHNTAVIIPDLPSLEAWATQHGVATPAQPVDLLRQPGVRELIRAEIDRNSRAFKGYEQIRDFVVDGELFSTQNDLLTHSLKIKRRNVLTKYRNQLDALYRSRAA